MHITGDPAILVTGGAGYIGSHVVLALRDRGYRVVVIDDLSTGFRSHVPVDVPFYEGDIADRALLDKIVAGEPVKGSCISRGRSSLGSLSNNH